MLSIFIIICRERKGRKRLYYNTAALATTFLTFPFNVDDLGVMTESRGKKPDTSLSSDKNWATNDLCKQLLIHLASFLTFPYFPTEYENYYTLHFEVQIYSLTSQKNPKGKWRFLFCANSSSFQWSVSFHSSSTNCFYWSVPIPFSGWMSKIGKQVGRELKLFQLFLPLIISWIASKHKKVKTKSIIHLN